MRFLVLLLVLSVALFTLATGYTHNQTIPQGMTTQRLSDRDLSINSAMNATIITQQHGAHIIWRQRVPQDPPAFKLDTFYAYLPSGETRQLSDPNQTIAGPGGLPPQAAVDSQGNIHALWDDHTPDNASDLFYWQSDWPQPMNLSDRAFTSGSVNKIHLAVDENDAAHALWTESIFAGGGYYKAFYWREGQQTMLLSNPDTPSGPSMHARALFLQTYTGVAHVLYHDFYYPEPIPGQVHYWNSEMENGVQLKPDLTAEGHFQSAFMDDTGVVHVLWYSDRISEYDLYYWNSAVQQNDLIATFSSSYDAGMYRDGNQNAHVIYQTGNSVFHWHSTTKTTQEWSFSSGSLLKRADGHVGNSIHMVWKGRREGDTTDNIYYWHSDMNEPEKITPADETASASNNVGLFVEDDNTVHVAWWQENAYYFNSKSMSTVVVEGPVMVGGSSWDFEQNIVVHDSVLYWLLMADEGIVPIPHYLWRSDEQILTPIPSVYDTGQRSPQGIWLDAAANPHVLWLDNTLPNEGSNMHYWNPVTGSQDITDIEDTTGNVSHDSIMKVSDELGFVYVIWTEQVENSNRYDLYAAYGTILEYHTLYLPVVVR